MAKSPKQKEKNNPQDLTSPESKKKVRTLRHEEGFVEVSQTMIGKTSRSGKPLKVRPFISEPASVEVHLGTWFPTGDMKGAKLDVTVRMPCYPEELTIVYQQTEALVDKLLDRLYVKMTKGDDDG